MNEEYKNDKCNGKCKDIEANKMKEFAKFYGPEPTQERKGIFSWLRTPMTITFAESLLVCTSLLWLVRKELEAVVVGAMPYGNLLVALTVFLVLTYGKRR
jgi:hypothetical protein